MILIALLGAAGLLNLVWTLSRRRSAVELRGCLLAAAALLLFAAALLAQATRQNAFAVAAFGLGIPFALLWFHHIYTQSLHNTTM